ncbi:hypothetical protein DBR06_SOUSAS1010137, partial [Sousa chinensis]
MPKPTHSLSSSPFPSAKFPLIQRRDCPAIPPHPSPKTLVPNSSTYQQQGPFPVWAVTTVLLTLEWKHHSFSLQTPAQVGKKEMHLSPGAETAAVPRRFGTLPVPPDFHL